LIQKELVRFKRSTTIKDDICYSGRNFEPITEIDKCDDCRVHIVTDRFLSKHFQKEIMKDERPYPNGIYPYVLIVDSSKCNLRCRPCYSWIFWKPEERAQAVIVSSEQLADYFVCKINKLHDDSLLKGKRIGKHRDKRPFSRIRVSGGEPLFDKKDPKKSLRYWLEYLGYLDRKLDGLKGERFELIDESGWNDLSKEEKWENFPIFLASDSGKIRIRFDTNGFLFGDPNFAEKFVKGIYDLEMENLTIDLTYSLKGTNNHEVRLMIDPGSELDASKLGVIKELVKHPQWLPLKNLKESILEYEDEEVLLKESDCVVSEDYFNPWGDVSITVEKGIMHNPREKLYLYDKERALPWADFDKQLMEEGFRLSKTENKIYFGLNPGAKAWSYMKKVRGNYEIVFMREGDDRPIYSFSTRERSQTSSKEHKKVRWQNDNFYDLKNRIETVLSGNLSDEEMWIELRPLSSS